MAQKFQKIKTKLLKAFAVFAFLMVVMMLVGSYKTYIPPHKEQTCHLADLRDVEVFGSRDDVGLTPVVILISSNQKAYSDVLLVFVYMGYPQVISEQISFEDLRQIPMVEVECGE